MRERSGRTMAKHITSTDTGTLTGEIVENVETGSTVCADEHSGYTKLPSDYQHRSVCHSAKEFVNQMTHTNGIESVWAVLKRGYNGAYHNWSVKYLQRYINEFASA